jgi:hypothetical protein
MSRRTIGSSPELGFIQNEQLGPMGLGRDQAQSRMLSLGERPDARFGIEAESLT